MGQEKPCIEKELNWLSFDERMLQEAADKSNPLIKGMRLPGICSSSLGEFHKAHFVKLK